MKESREAEREREMIVCVWKLNTTVEERKKKKNSE